MLLPFLKVFTEIDLILCTLLGEAVKDLLKNQPHGSREKREAAWLQKGLNVGGCELVAWKGGKRNQEAAARAKACQSRPSAEPSQDRQGSQQVPLFAGQQGGEINMRTYCAQGLPETTLRAGPVRMGRSGRGRVHRLGARAGRDELAEVAERGGRAAEDDLAARRAALGSMRGRRQTATKIRMNTIKTAKQR